MQTKITSALAAAGPDYLLATTPEAGSIIPVSAGVFWLRMLLPFALNHINLWLLEDGAGWTVIDCGFAGNATRAAGADGVYRFARRDALTKSEEKPT